MSSNFRITQRGLGMSVLRNLQGNLGEMQKLQEQMSSGRSISKPSDSPTGTVSALRFRSDIRRSEQVTRNIDDGIGWLGSADQALTQMSSTITRVRELMLRAAQGTSSPSELEAVAAELDTLRDHALALANTQYLGRAIFSGTAGGSRAYDPSTAAYVGDAGVVERTVAPGVRVQVNVAATDVFGPPGNDLFSFISQVAADVRAGNRAAVGGVHLNSLDAAATRVYDALAGVGARYNQLEVMKTRMDDQVVELRTGLSNVEDVDLPQTIVELQMQEVAYKSALSATQRVIQPSLVDFLR